jgi:hypothetical protein
MSKDELGERITDMMNRSGLDGDKQMEVALNVVLSILSGTKCPDCRKLQADAVSGCMPDLIAQAMAAPSERDHLH